MVVVFFLFWGQRLSSDAPKVPERLLACKKVDVQLNDFPKNLQTLSPEQALQGCSAGCSASLIPPLLVLHVIRRKHG